MKIKKAKRISITKKLAVLMMLIVILQGILCCSVFVLNGGFGYLEKSACSSFANTANTRKNTLENFMVNRWSNLDEYQREIEDSIAQQLSDKGRTVRDLDVDKELNNDIIMGVSEKVIDMLRYNSTTEAYIILNGYGRNEEAKEHCGLLIRDLDQDVTMSSKGFLLEKGAAQISRKTGIALDSYWSSKFILDESVMDTKCYTEPIKAAEKYKDFDSGSLGYWSSFFRWEENDIKVMSYSVPLMQDGEAYGVIGITVSEDYLESLLPSKELDPDESGSYVLAKTEDGRRYNSVFANGIISKEISEGTGILTFEKEPRDQKVYLLDDGNQNYGNVQTLELYSSISPFEQAEWVLIGILPKETLLKSSDRLQLSIFMAFALSVILGIIGAAAGSYRFTKPILLMADEIRTKDVNEKMEFRPSDVEEIDELGNAISVLSTNVRENASKVSKIIELVNLPLGVMEYNINSEKVFCTDKIVTMLDMDRDHYQNGFMDKKYFEKYFEENQLSGLLKENVEFDYQIQGKTAGRWLHFKSLIDNDKVLVALTDISRDVYERQKIEYERDYDILTQLLNRRAFKRQMTKMLENAKENGLKTSAMIMWDLDNLKYVNDTYGHDYGDQYIQRAASVFAHLMQVGGIVGRMSGDEFLAFVPDCGTKRQLLDMVAEIKEQLNRAKITMPDGEKIGVRASGGIAWYPDDGMTYEDLTKYADFAMYDTKNSYKGEFKEFNKKAYEKDALLLQGKEQLNKLIEGKLVSYAFQPIVDVKSGEIFAYEALMRPTMKELSSPSDVMRLAASQSRLPDIEALTFTEAISFYAKQREGFGKCKLFINSIPNQVLKEEMIVSLLRKYHVSGNKIVVEMIENEQADIEVMEEKISMLKSLDFEIAIDDFGSGYNSESTFLYMQPDYVKIDINIVRDIDKDKNRQSLALSTVNYAKPRGIKVIAEGVETIEELSTLIQLDVDYIQGYYMGRPDMTVQDISLEVGNKIRELKLKNFEN